ncbi:hypothetical protein BGZ76_008790 [Entomortierella beljakovae]|nr:hypothetical protein BGZ76_008790 [Entomortierella beljakovae]
MLVQGVPSESNSTSEIVSSPGPDSNSNSNSNSNSSTEPKSKYNLTGFKNMFKRKKPQSKLKPKPKTESVSQSMLEKLPEIVPEIRPFTYIEERGWGVTEVMDFDHPDSITHIKATRDLLLALPRDRDKDQFDLYAYVIRLGDCTSPLHRSFWPTFKQIFVENEKKFVLIVTGCSDAERIRSNTYNIQQTFGRIPIVYCDLEDVSGRTASLYLMEDQLRNISRGRPPISHVDQNSGGFGSLVSIRHAISRIKHIFTPPEADLPTRKIILVGNQGAGKSSIGNMLTQGKLSDENTFVINPKAPSKSGEVEVHHGRNWEVCEASGFCGLDGDGAVKASERVHLIKNAQEITKGGYHYYAYVVSARDFNEDKETRSFNFFKSVFDSCKANFVVIFTHCEDDKWVTFNSPVVNRVFGEVQKLYCDFPFDRTKVRHDKRKRTFNRKQLESSLRSLELSPVALRFEAVQKNDMSRNYSDFFGNLTANLITGLIESSF